MNSAGAGRHADNTATGPMLDALTALPGGPQLIELGARRGDVALVGGAVRDLLLGRAPREIDVVVDGSAVELAEELASSLRLQGVASTSVTAHERFGTAVVSWEAGRIDIAMRRAESYATPGALPDVRAAGTAEDLARRDFTVNAIAVALGGEQAGQLLGVEHAVEDLASRRLRVLHDASFAHDPTRLLRMARYSARLGFQPEPHTASLARAALAAGALGTVSRARIGAELRLAIAEASATAALAAMDELGVLAHIDTALEFNAGLAGRAVALLPADGRHDLLLVGVLLLSLSAGEDRERTMFELLHALEFTAAERERAIRTALGAQSIVAQLQDTQSASQINAALCTHTLEAVALAAAMSSSAMTAARDWLERLRHVRLEIGGEDLLAAGVPSGPEIGRRLAAALALKLDGRIEAGREGELRAALQVTR